MRWRARLHVLHRDVGFLCLGMTLVYAISGVAVNHREDWDYNLKTEVTRVMIGNAATLLGVDVADADLPRLAETKRAELIPLLTAAANLSGEPQAVFWRGPRLSLFFGPGETEVVDYWPHTGELEHTRKHERWLLRQLNFLHLNEANGGWTWTADLFAVALLFLGLSGVVMARGPRALTGRGGLLVVVGIIVPVAGYLLFR